MAGRICGTNRTHSQHRHTRTLHANKNPRVESAQYLFSSSPSRHLSILRPNTFPFVITSALPPTILLNLTLVRDTKKKKYK